MDETVELQQIIYGFLSAQIEFGVYGPGEALPRMEDAGRWFSVSLDTVRAAYLRLKRQGYITLTKKAGAAVAADFSPEETEDHVQRFFALRKDAVMDLCRALDPFFSRAQWLALKNAPPERLDELERLCLRPDPPPPYAMVRHLGLIYDTLHNDLLLRLVWQAFLFYQAPFLSLPQNRAAFKDGDGPLLRMLALCRRQDWDGLWRAVEEDQRRLLSTISRFYSQRITSPPAGEPVPFHWSAYQSTSQRCYSLAMDLLQDIHLGRYPRDGLLPSPARLARERQVSVSTVRRTLALLNQLGATRSINGVGTKALRAEDSARNCDFSHPVLRKRLVDFVQSLHILAITGRSCAQSAFAVMDAPAMEALARHLTAIEAGGRNESVVFDSLAGVMGHCPIGAVRKIYGQLLQILVWGYPLRGTHGSREAINAYYLPYITALRGCLERRDGEGFSANLEDMLRRELTFAARRLEELGIGGAAALADLI